MNPIEFLQSNPVVVAISVGLFGLLVGSFLNVVIYRLPLMMQREWRQQCEQLFGEKPPSPPNGPQTSFPPPVDQPFNLARPRSRCPHCGHPISALENIPVLSYILLKGRCKQCHARISVRYPVIETVTAALFSTVAWHFGFTWETAAALLLTSALISLTVIDFDHQLLPDDITLPLLWLGIAVNLPGLFTDTQSSIIGAMAGYGSLWLVYIVFKLVTGKEGMGYGDFKLLAALGAWMGWQALPIIIFLSAFVGAAVGISLIAIRGRDHNLPIPYGPYLAAAGWIAFLWGDRISAGYFSLVGLST